MSESWTWTYEDAQGAELTGEAFPTTSFPTQSDAENWLGESWRDLAEHGASGVSLHRDKDLVYGPMSLESSW
jgi:hypothetical protein